MEKSYNNFKIPNWEKSIDAIVSDILQFLNTLQDGSLNVYAPKPKWKSKA